MANQSRLHTRLVDILRASQDSDSIRYEFSEDGTELILHNIEVKVKFQTDSDTPFILEQKNFTATGEILQLPTYGQYATQTVNSSGISWTGIDSEGYMAIQHRSDASGYPSGGDSDVLEYWDGSRYHTLENITFGPPTPDMTNPAWVWSWNINGTWAGGTPASQTGTSVLIRDSEGREPFGQFRVDSRRIFVGADSDSETNSNVVSGGVDIVFGEKEGSTVKIGRSDESGIAGWNNDGTNPSVRFESVTIDSDSDSISRNLRGNITFNDSFTVNSAATFVFNADSEATITAIQIDEPSTTASDYWGRLGATTEAAADGSTPTADTYLFVNFDLDDVDIFNNGVQVFSGNADDWGAIDASDGGPSTGTDGFDYTAKIDSEFATDASGRYYPIRRSGTLDSEEPIIRHNVGTFTITGNITDSDLTINDSDNAFTFDAKNLDFATSQTELKIINADGSTAETYQFAKDRT